MRKTHSSEVWGNVLDKKLSLNAPLVRPKSPHFGGLYNGRRSDTRNWEKSKRWFWCENFSKKGQKYRKKAKKVKKEILKGLKETSRFEKKGWRGLLFWLFFRVFLFFGEFLIYPKFLFLIFCDLNSHYRCYFLFSGEFSVF